MRQLKKIARLAQRLARDPALAGNVLHLTGRMERSPFYAGRWFGQQLSDDDRRQLGLGLLALDGIVVTFTRAGLTWTADVGISGICQQLMLEGNYQGDDVARLIKWLREHRPEQTVVVDVGANLGTTTIPFALAGYNVVAIEAVPATFAMLEANVAQNGLGHMVECVHRAVSRDPVVTMKIARDSGVNETAGDSTPGFESQGHELIDVIEVAGEGLSAILQRLHVEPEQIAVVWSDTQGSEAEVIRTGEDLWETIPLFAEFWPHGLEVHGTELDDYMKLLQTYFSDFALIEDLDRKRDLSELVNVDLGPSQYCDVLLTG